MSGSAGATSRESSQAKTGERANSWPGACPSAAPLQSRRDRTTQPACARRIAGEPKKDLENPAMKIPLMLAAAFVTATLVSSAAPPTAPLASAISWSSKFPGTWTWDGANTEAQNWVENGYSDWRLPTVAEIQASITDGSLDVVWNIPGGTNYLWSSETTGTRYAYAVAINADANGNIIVSKSGAKTKLLRGSSAYGFGVRP
jgi:hypothetical protein